MSKRVSLILPDLDEAVVAPYVTSGTPENEVLRQWATARGSAVSFTEASALRVLLRAGAERLREEALDSAYADLAAELDGDVERRHERRSARTRYAARTDAHLA